MVNLTEIVAALYVNADSETPPFAAHVQTTFGTQIGYSIHLVLSLSCGFSGQSGYGNRKVNTLTSDCAQILRSQQVCIFNDKLFVYRVTARSPTLIYIAISWCTHVGAFDQYS